MLPFKYKSAGFSENGIYVELYLPKHARFQGKLYQTLTDGFDHKKVKAHFLNSEKRPRIIEMLQHHGYTSWVNYTDRHISSLKSLYWGYSLYEVDGVFKPSRGKKIIEERTQVIRIMFLPTELDRKLTTLGVTPHSHEHRYFLDIVSTFLRTARHIEEIDNYAGKEKRILKYVLDWCLAVGFFLIGYVVFEICSEIEKLGDIKETEYEQEVWLTSFWHFSVNRIKFAGKLETE